MSELRSYIFWYPAVVKKKKKAYVYDDKREDNPRFDTCSFNQKCCDQYCRQIIIKFIAINIYDGVYDVLIPFI